MNPPVYRDEKKKIEYLFLNFDPTPTEREMLGMSERYGKPRRTPLGKQRFESGPIVGSIDWGEIWEYQVIHRKPSDEKKKTPEEILVYDLGCRMLATD